MAVAKRLAKRDIESLTESLKDQLVPAVVCISHSWGGLEQIAAKDALDLGQLGIRPRVLCISGSPIHEHLATRDEVIPIPLEFRPRDYFDFKMRTLLQRLTREEGVNLIHCHQPSLLGSIAPWFWNRREVALVASRHIMNSHSKKNPFHRALYRRLDSLAVMSETLKANVLATHPLRDRQVKVVRYGLDFKSFDPKKVDPLAQRMEWGVDSKAVLIGLVGRIDPAKGQETLLKAMAGLSVRVKRGELLKCVLVGEQTRGGHSNHLEELKKMVAQFHLEDRVIFAGFKENIPEVMAALDIFVMPSRQEAFGLVAIEAMAMETPVVISNGGSALEIVGAKEEYGCLVRPNDPFDLQRRIRWLLERSEERSEMGKKGREYIKKNYDARIRVQRTLQLYERCLRRRKLLS